MTNKVAKAFHEFKWVGLIFVVMVAIKTVLFFGPNSPIVPWDEWAYTNMGKDLFSHFGYPGTHFPMLYPLLLSLTFFFKSHFFEAAKILNFVLTSAIIFPLFAIARIYLDKQKSVLIAIACSFIPFCFISASSSMSENLYFPLLMLACYFVLRKKENNLAWDIGLGVLFGAMMMTRYISLVIIPVLMIMWWLKNVTTIKEVFKFTVKKIGRVVLIGTMFVLAYAPWFVPKLLAGEGIKKIMGSEIASQSNPAQLTLANLFTWIAIYGLYFVVLIVPVFVLLFFVGFRLDKVKGQLFSIYNRLILLVALLMGAFTVAIVRHSWKAYYNMIEKQKVMGRYVIYFAALFILVAVVTIELVSKEKIKKFLNTTWKKFLFVFLTNAIYIGLLAYGISVLFYGGMPTVSTTILVKAAPIDLSLIKANVVVYLSIALTVNILASVLMVFGKKKFVSLLLCVGVIAANVASYPALFKSVDYSVINAQHAYNLTRVFRTEKDRTLVTSVVFSKQARLAANADALRLTEDMKYYLLDSEYSAPKAEFAGDYLEYDLGGLKGYVVLAEGEKVLSDFVYVNAYVYDNHKYLIYRFNRFDGVEKGKPGAYYTTTKAYFEKPLLVMDFSNLELGNFSFSVSKLSSKIDAESAKFDKNFNLKFNFKEDTYIGLKIKALKKDSFTLGVARNGQTLKPSDLKETNGFAYFLCPKGENTVILSNTSLRTPIELLGMVFFTDSTFAQTMPSVEFQK
ncbi:MAG: glycosyltransferase family 39 protein [Clostridia bacterium]